MTLFISPSYGGSPIINVSGSSMEFSIDFDGDVANITALSYLVDVSMTGNIAHIRWYQQEYPSTPYQYVYWYTPSASITPYGVVWNDYTIHTGTYSLSYSTGTSISSNFPSGAGENVYVWYQNYYQNYLSQHMYFMGYTFFCKFTGYYNIYTDKVYVYLGPGFNPLGTEDMSFTSTIKISLAGRSKETTDSSGFGIFSEIYTEHDGLEVTDVLLVSGTSYTLDVDYSIVATGYGDYFVGNIYKYNIAFRTLPPDTEEGRASSAYAYRVTGSSG